jgi:putative oxidoreductase
MIKKFFSPGTNSCPVSAGLLLLRLWVGLAMLKHGLEKVSHYDAMKGMFGDPIGIGPTASLNLVIFAEVGCAILLAAGLLTRFGALALAINMAVAFFVAHKGALSGPKSGELAWIYLGAFLALLLAGPGCLSLDSKLFCKCPAPSDGSPASALQPPSTV